MNDMQANNTTKFVSESEGMQTSVMKPIHMTKDILASGKNSEQDIRDFLAKPIMVRTGTLAGSDTGSTFVQIDIDNLFNTQPMWAAKLYGYFGIRATAIIRLQVNTNRFQQGRYILAWVPTGGSTSSYNTTPQFSRRWFDRTAVTQLPHVEIDLGTQTECILKVPYLTTYTHYPLIATSTGNGSRGVFKLYPYSGVVSSGAVSVGYNIYVSWEDVDLASAAIPQMAKFNIGIEYPQGIFDNFSSTVKTAIAQERKSSGAGPVEASLKVAGKGSSFIAQHVPLLNEIARPVTWALGVGAGIANWFGWSNPVDLSKTTRALQTWFPFSVNCDAIDSSKPLCLFSQNELEVLPGLGGTDIDEMSIQHLLTIPAFYRSYSWAVSNTQNTTIAWFPLEPREFQTRSTVNTTHTLFSQTPVCYFANMCGLWRGGFRFTFKVVKTEFHSGRIGVLFQPYDINTAAITTPPDWDDIGHYAIRHILDIRDTNEFQLDIPYTSLRPYHSNPALTSVAVGSGNIGSATAWDPFGYLGLYVVNPLNAPSTVSQSVTILVEVSGLDDFEIAMPHENCMNIVTPQYVQMNTFAIAHGETGSKDSGSKDKPAASAQEFIGNSYAIRDNMAGARLCIGEKITSALQFLKMCIPWPGSFGTITTNCLIDPFAITTAELATSSSYQTNFTGSDYYELFASCFAFSRGSIRIKMYRDAASTTVSSPIYTCLIGTSGRTDYNGFVIPAPATFIDRQKEMRVIQNQAFTGGVEISTGAYSQSFTKSNFGMTCCPNGVQRVVYRDPGTSAFQLVVVNDSSTDNSNYRLMRQVGDDFQLGLFCGVPQLYL